MSLACRSLNVYGLLFRQIRAYELSAITLCFPLQHFFSLSGQFCTYAVEHPGENELKPLRRLSGSLCCIERQARGGCQLPHTQLCLSLPGHGTVSGLDGTQIR